MTAKKQLESLADYAHDLTKEVIERFGPRYSSSDAERKANEWIEQEFKKYCDETHFEEFETRPNLYPQGIFKVVGVFVLAAAATIVFLPGLLSIVPALLVACGLLVLAAELFYLKRWISPLFKKGISTNAWGTIRPKGEVKARVVFEGHVDSAKQMRIAEHEKIPFGKFALGVTFIAATLGFAIAKVIGSLASTSLPSWFTENLLPGATLPFTGHDATFLIVAAILLPFFVYLIYSLHGSTIVPGADDNLAAVGVAGAIGKYFREHEPEHVEIIIGSMGSEEIGDQGAKAFVAKHGDILSNSYAFIMDGIGGGNAFNVITKDFHAPHGYSMEVIERIEKAHERYKHEDPNVAPLERRKLGLGSSDACMYTHAGFKASFIISVLDDGTTKKGFKKPPNWHSVRDTWQNLHKNMLKDAIGMGIAFVEIVDDEQKGR